MGKQKVKLSKSTQTTKKKDSLKAYVVSPAQWNYDSMKIRCERFKDGQLHLCLKKESMFIHLTIDECAAIDTVVDIFAKKLPDEYANGLKCGKDKELKFVPGNYGLMIATKLPMTLDGSEKKPTIEEIKELIGDVKQIDNGAYVKTQKDGSELKVFTSIESVQKHL